jgi:hypothetical protein
MVSPLSLGGLVLPDNTIGYTFSIARCSNVMSLSPYMVVSGYPLYNMLEAHVRVGQCLPYRFYAGSVYEFLGEASPSDFVFRGVDAGTKMFSIDVVYKGGFLAEVPKDFFIKVVCFHDELFGYDTVRLYFRE